MRDFWNFKNLDSVLKRSGSFASKDQWGWRVEVLPAVIDHEEIVLEHVVVPFFLQLFERN
ncbi:MAG: hypothetical protein ACK56I_13230 [bacterium]